MSKAPQLLRGNPDIVYETIDGETVVVNLKSGNYYSMVGVGSMIWTELEEGRTVDQVITRLNNEYDGSLQEIETAVHQFLQALAQEQLLTFETPVTVSPPIESTSIQYHESGETKLKFQAPRLQKFTDMQELLLLDPIHEVDETGWPHTANKENTELPG